MMRPVKSEGRNVVILSQTRPLGSGRKNRLVGDDHLRIVLSCHGPAFAVAVRASTTFYVL